MKVPTLQKIELNRTNILELFKSPRNKMGYFVDNNDEKKYYSDSGFTEQRKQCADTIGHIWKMKLNYLKKQLKTKKVNYETDRHRIDRKN